MHRFVGHVASALDFRHHTGVFSEADLESVRRSFWTSLELYRPRFSLGFGPLDGRNLAPAAYADVKAWDVDYWAARLQG